MGTAKIDAYYNDPVKLACDAHSAVKSYALRSATVETGMRWSVERWSKFAVHAFVGALREMLYGTPQAVETSNTAPAHSSGSMVRSPALKWTAPHPFS